MKRDNRAEYTVWIDMRRRCSDPRRKAYPAYGGRGIRVCDRWQDSFDAFFADMGPRPKGHSIDRIDNDGHYEPGNCRWATQAEQMRNRSVTVHLEIEGVKKPLIDWCNERGVDPGLVLRRVQRWKWDPARALATPTLGRGGAIRRRRGGASNFAKLTEAQVLAIRADSRTQAVIAKDYGLEQTAVSAIKLRKSWKHI